MHALLVFGLSILLLGSGCSEKEGILINTRSDMGEAIYSLSFFVGVDTVATDDYFAQAKEIEDVIVEGRDLATEPFKLFLNPPVGSPEAERPLSDHIFVGVVAYNFNDEIVGYGFSDTLVFVSGKVLEWDLSIRPVDRENAGYREVGDCLKWRTGPETWIHIGGGTDKDCDGFNTTDPEPDCDDFNPTIHPNADEKCDNGLDDNCNGMVDDAEDVDQDTYSPCSASDDTWDCDDTNSQLPIQHESCGGVVLSCEDGNNMPPTQVGDRCFVSTFEGCFKGFLVCDKGSDESELICDTSEDGARAKIGLCEAYENCEQPNPSVVWLLRLLQSWDSARLPTINLVKQTKFA